jgi:hypothetical protein
MVTLSILSKETYSSKNQLIIETDFFQRPEKSTKRLISKKASSFGQFLSKEIKFV